MFGTILKKAYLSAKISGKAITVAVDSYGDERLMCLPDGRTRPALDTLADEVGPWQALDFLKEQGIAVSAPAHKVARKRLAR